MNHREMVRAALEGLPSSADAVASPDHPLLLHGPDLIAAFNGTLAAYFISTRGTAQVVSSLPRVMLSRLALPPATTCVLILDETVDLDDNYSSFFEEVVTLGRRSRKVPVGETAYSEGMEAAESLRIVHHERFADTWTATTRQKGVRRRRLPGEASSALTRNLTLQPERGMDISSGEYIFVPPETSNRRRLRASLSGAIDVAVTGDYGLQAGQNGLRYVTELINSRAAHLARHSGQFPPITSTRVFDAQKPLRAAAFAGYALKLQDPYAS